MPQQLPFTRRIHAVHLLNDFSGSPLVFQMALQDAIDGGHEVHLYTATPSGDGFLSKLEVFRSIALFYRWSPNKVLTLFFFLWAQCSLFAQLLWRLKKEDTVYVNTLLPFGAMWAAKLRGCLLVVHVHEVSLKPAALKNFLVWTTEKTAHHVVFVSAFLSRQYQFSKPTTAVVLNRLPAAFVQRIPAEKTKALGQPKTVLMLCSLKKYKGIYEFVEIARQTPDWPFELVLNASETEVMQWAASANLPLNCRCFASQSNTHPFYARAGVVMNLSRPNEWLETFGMTVLEALAYGAYVIVPTEGAPKELIEPGVTGSAIDGTQTQAISQLIHQTLSLRKVS